MRNQVRLHGRKGPGRSRADPRLACDGSELRIGPQPADADQEAENDEHGAVGFLQSADTLLALVQQVATTGNDATTYSHTGLSAGQTRHYRVSPINSVGTSGPSNVDSATTSAADTAPGVPTGLGANAVGQNRIDLSWTAPANDGGSQVTGYRIEFSPDGGSWTDVVADTQNTNTNYSDTGLASGTTRHYRVSAINAVGTGLASSPAMATTDRAPPPPPSPRPSAPAVVRDDRTLKLALWTDRPGYRAGETVRLYRTTEPRGDCEDYEMLYYLERTGGGDRRYLSTGRRSKGLQEQAVDHLGRPEGGYIASPVQHADRELIWKGEVPEPGLWQFVVELR